MSPGGDLVHLPPGEQARRLVRHGLRDVLTWLGEDPGPSPGPFPRCHYCRDAGQTRDHIVPHSLGGPNRAENIVFACQACNVARDNSPTACCCPKCVTAVQRFGSGRPENAYVLGSRAPRTGRCQAV